MVAHADTRVVHRGGSKINFREPVITQDSRFLLCASGEYIKVFSTSTEECIHHLQGHTDLVTGLVLNPSNHLQVYSCSEDGTVRLWDFTDGILIRTYNVGKRISSIHVSNTDPGVVFLVIPAKRNKHDTFQLVSLRLPPSVEQLAEAGKFSSVLESVRPHPKCIAFGQGGGYVASVKANVMFVHFFKKKANYRFALGAASGKAAARNTFTCVTCHPKDDCIATGHGDGKIRLWRNFNQQRDYTCSTVHWHHSAVSALCFTPEGSNLLSGGLEAVLVQWRYGQQNEKDFLPRLGSAISAIAVSPDGSLFCTSHTDNKITVIQNCSNVSAVIQGLVHGDAVKTALMVDPRTQALVLNGKPGHLQFYSLQRDKQLYNLDIVQQEYINQSKLDQFEVVMAALDAQGSWLATLEQRDAAEVEMSLKLWAFDEHTQSFVLNTTIAAPHDGLMTDMCFSPSSGDATLVTVSLDGRFKVWQLTRPDPSEEEEPSWSCDFVGAYHSLVPGRCCFSADGSLLAVAFKEVVTVWSPASWELLTTLSQPPGAIRDLCFGRLSCSKYLLGSTDKNLLCCWNLLTCSLEWSTSLDVSLLLADPLSENVGAFCAAADATDLFVFRPSEPRPVFSQRALCSGRVTRAVFAPRADPLDSCQEALQWLNRSQLYFLTANTELLTFLTKTEEERLMAASKQPTIDGSVAMTPFYLLLGKHAKQQEERDLLSSQSGVRTLLPQGSVAMKELLHTPAHVLPPTSALCSLFLRSLLLPASDHREEDPPGEEEMASEEEDEDSEEEEAAGRPRPEQGSAAAPAPGLALSRTQQRELRGLKKLDFSWVHGVVRPEP